MERKREDKREQRGGRAKLGEKSQESAWPKRESEAGGWQTRELERFRVGKGTGQEELRGVTGA